eukprot:6614401-Alexandrium_andersonii.AAC.1
MPAKARRPRSSGRSRRRPPARRGPPRTAAGSREGGMPRGELRPWRPPASRGSAPRLLLAGPARRGCPSRGGAVQRRSGG